MSVSPKRFALSLCAAAFSLIVSASARAELLAYEGFDHPAGSLVGRTGALGFKSPYTAMGSGLSAASPGMVYAGLPTTGNKVALSGTANGIFAELTHSPETPGTTIYFSYLAQVTSGSSYAGVSLFQGDTEMLYTGRINGYFGVDTHDGTQAATATPVSKLSLIVCRVDFAANSATIRLYVNPTSPIEPPYARLTVTRNSPITYDRIRIASSGVTGSIDEFRLGTTFADVCPVAPGASPEKVVVLGSSVAWGQGASPQSQGWAYRLQNLLQNQAPIVPGSEVKWQVANASIPGDTTGKVLARFQNDLVNAHPDGDIVIIGLSLANEGLVGANDAAAQSVYESFRSGMAEIISRCRQNGYYPVIGLVYPNGNYTASQYGFVKRMNLLLNSWNVPSFNFLGGPDNGSGKWAPGHETDPYHPNNAGHGEMYYTIVPSLFDAIAAGKTALPGVREPSVNTYLRLTRNDAQPAPISFVPPHPMHSATMAFRVRLTGTGTIAAIGAGANRATLEVQDAGVIYYGPNGAAQSIIVDINDGKWHDIALSHRYATNQTFVFIDGVQRATLNETFAPDRFVLGGADGAAGRVPAPAQADYRELCIYRASWTPEEAMAQSNGATQQASLEIFSPLADSDPESGKALENRAQSLTNAVLNTASFTKITAQPPPDNLTAYSFAPGTTSLTWTSMGYGGSGFTIERRRTGVAEAWTTAGTSPGNVPGFEDSGLISGQSYDYRVSTAEGALQGDYSKVVTIVAGGQSALSYDEWVAEQFASNASTYLIDFNTTASPNYDGTTWNTISSSTNTTPRALVDTNGSSSGYTFAITDGFDQTRDDGGSVLADYPATAQRTMFALRDDNPLTGSMTISGLDPNKTYDFAFFARRGSLVAGYDYTGIYTFTGGGTPVSVIVDAATNTEITSVPGLQPSAGGTITLTITGGPGAGNDFPVINFLRFSENDPQYEQDILPTSDPDGDGITNFEEYARGLNPHVADDEPFDFDDIESQSGANLRLKITRNRKAKDVTYALEKSTDLELWEPATGSTTSVDGAFGAIETLSYDTMMEEPFMFFRVRME